MIICLVFGDWASIIRRKLLNFSLSRLSTLDGLSDLIIVDASPIVTSLHLIPVSLEAFLFNVFYSRKLLTLFCFSSVAHCTDDIFGSRWVCCDPSVALDRWGTGFEGKCKCLFEGEVSIVWLKYLFIRCLGDFLFFLRVYPPFSWITILEYSYKKSSFPFVVCGPFVALECLNRCILMI